jgi:hypothetical protein
MVSVCCCISTPCRPPLQFLGIDVRAACLLALFLLNRSRLMDVSLSLFFLSFVVSGGAYGSSPPRNRVICMHGTASLKAASHAFRCCPLFNVPSHAGHPFFRFFVVRFRWRQRRRVPLLQVLSIDLIPLLCTV